MCLNKISRTSSRNIGPQHKTQRYTRGVLCIPVFTKPIWSVRCWKAHFLVSSDHRSQSHLKFQSCLTTEYAGVCFEWARIIFLETLPNNMWWCRCCFTIAEVLEESLASQTLLLTVHWDDTDTRPLPGSFVTFYVDWKFADGGNGNFHCSGSFLKAISLICEAQLSFAAHQKYIICFFFIVMMIKGICALFSLLFIVMLNRKPWLDNSCS